jgi:hypothetical protein
VFVHLLTLACFVRPPVIFSAPVPAAPLASAALAGAPDADVVDVGSGGSSDEVRFISAEEFHPLAAVSRQTDRLLVEQTNEVVALNQWLLDEERQRLTAAGTAGPEVEARVQVSHNHLSDLIEHARVAKDRADAQKLQDEAVILRNRDQRLAKLGPLHLAPAARALELGTVGILSGVDLPNSNTGTDTLRLSKAPLIPLWSLLASQRTERRAWPIATRRALAPQSAMPAVLNLVKPRPEPALLLQQASGWRSG